LSDNIFIDLDRLFETSTSELSQEGKAQLKQLMIRVNSYEKVARIEIHGLTKKYGPRLWRRPISNAKNDALTSYLRLYLHESIPLGILSESESEVYESKSSEVKKLFSDKAFARIFADGVKPGASSITMCSPKGNTEIPALSRFETNRFDNKKPSTGLFDGPMILSIGDRVRIRVPEDTDIEGIYEIDSDGHLDVPYGGKVLAQGMTVAELESRVIKRLIDEAIIHENFALVDISVLQWSVADVFVSGAVFNPGRKTINGLKIELKTFKQTQASGDAARERYLSNALTSAGGVRPDADIANILIRRNGEILRVNLEGILTGAPVPDISLITGDEVYVPSTGYFRKELARVSQITPAGLRLFVSNLATPRNPSQVETDTTKLPYGTRLLHVLMSTNCVGGTQLTNSAKRAVLITVNPVTQKTEVIERQVQQLVADPDRDHVNPFLMPNDAVACYDSNVTNYRDFARSITDILTPISLLRTLLRN
jgi:protein involved in polysaccharide export with SLBB domain